MPLPLHTLMILLAQIIIEMKMILDTPLLPLLIRRAAYASGSVLVQKATPDGGGGGQGSGTVASAVALPPRQWVGAQGGWARIVRAASSHAQYPNLPA